MLKIKEADNENDNDNNNFKKNDNNNNILVYGLILMIILQNPEIHQEVFYL